MCCCSSGLQLSDEVLVQAAKEHTPWMRNLAIVLYHNSCYEAATGSKTGLSCLYAAVLTGDKVSGVCCGSAVQCLTGRDWSVLSWLMCLMQIASYSTLKGSLTHADVTHTLCHTVRQLDSCNSLPKHGGRQVHEIPFCKAFSNALVAPYPPCAAAAGEHLKIQETAYCKQPS